jgi:hypothetical protein
MSKDKTPPDDDLDIIDVSSNKEEVEDFIEFKVEPVKVDQDVIVFIEKLTNAFPDHGILDVVKAYKLVKDQDTLNGILTQLGVTPQP